MNVPAFSRYLTSLRSSDNEDQLLNAICQVPRELLPFDACFLVLIDEEAGVPRLIRTSGFGELFLGEVTISERASLAGYVLSKKESLRLPDLKGKKEPGLSFIMMNPVLKRVPPRVFPSSQGVNSWLSRIRKQTSSQFDASSIQRGEIIAALVADAIANRKNELRWQARLEIDPLTGEQNVEYLHSRLHEIICEAETKGRQLALLSIAPNASSEFSDTPEEEVILHLSNSLKPFAAGNDILVRHEGPRFLLLLQGLLPRIR